MKKMNNKGFSLVELIVVIAIMAVLVGVLAPQFIKYVENSRRATDVQAAESIRSAILADIADGVGKYADEDGDKVYIKDDYLPTAIKDQDAPTMKSTNSAYKGKEFKASWNRQAGTCDVWSADSVFILTDPVGGAAYKNQETSAPSGQKATVGATGSGT